MQVFYPHKQSSLLSPPTSPRMSEYTAGPPNASWHDHQSRPSQPSHHPLHLTSFSAVSEEPPRHHLPPINTRPPLLRSHKSFPHTLSTSFSATTPQGGLTRGGRLETGGSDAKPVHRQPQLAELDRSEAAGPDRSESAPVSPNLQLTPTSPDAQNDRLLEETGEELRMGSVELEEEDAPVEGGTPKTAAERHAEKRKMKRFRLTHNQTRFLMSEFTRQAHPDAAHRERMSREIPGLSPRQVQVWFQNRRAKLKRLTSDDRERVLKSRALPEDFDMAHALHSPYGGNHGMGTPLASPASYLPSYHEGVVMRPLMMEGLRRQSEDEITTSPISMSSAYGNFFTPPGSVASDNMSPISTTSERAQWGTLPSSQNTSPRSGNPFTRSSSFSTAYHHPQLPRLQLHDRVTRTRAESLGSPLRSSMSYTGSALNYSTSQTTGPLVPNSDQRQIIESQSVPQPLQAPMAPYGLGPQGGALQGFQSSVLSRVRPVPGPFPASLQLKSDAIHPSGSSVCETPSFTAMHSAPLASLPEYSYQQPQLSAPYRTTSFNVTYTQHNASTTSLPSSLPTYGQPHEPHPRIQEIPNEDANDQSHNHSEVRPYNPYGFSGNSQ